MLKSIDPILNADLLYVLRAMGHGDELALVDCNFPSVSVAETTVFGDPIILDGVNLPAAAKAILSVFPLDSFVDEPVARMEIVGSPDELAPCHVDMRAALDASSDRVWKMGSVERFAFYERARQSFAIVTAAAERRPYGCFFLKKGVIAPDGSVM